MEIKKRNQGIDLLRIFSMLMVLILHICLQSGVLYRFEIGNAGYFSVWLIESLCYCAVNCYALITGYVMYEQGKSEFNYSRIIPLWCQVFFYSLLITLLFKIFMPETEPSLVNGFFPLLSSQYWYFTAYFGMFFFIPFMNLLIDNMSKKQFIIFAATLFVIFSFLPFTFAIEDEDLFSINSGYSPSWLIILYFAGAFIKRFDKEFRGKKRIWAAVYLLSSAVTLLDSALIDVIFDSLPGGKAYFYTSPFTVTAAVSLFMIFKDIPVKNKVFSKMISIFSQTAFGVYLIHVHPLVFENIMTRCFNFLNNMNWILMTICIIVSAALMFIALSAAEYIRILIFKALKIRERSDALVTFTISKVKSMKLK